jgi:hypothetical protein
MCMRRGGGSSRRRRLTVGGRGKLDIKSNGLPTCTRISRNNYWKPDRFDALCMLRAFVPRRPGPPKPGPTRHFWPSKHCQRDRVFLKKRIKKLKFEKGEPDGKNSENGYLSPVDRAGGVGPRTSLPPKRAGGPKKFQDPSREPLREYEKFLICEEVPEADLPPGQWAGGAPAYDFCSIFLEFMFHKLFEIQTFFKYKIYSPYSYVCI